MSVVRISSLWPRTEILQENLINLQVYKALYISSHSVKYQVPLSVRYKLEFPTGASERMESGNKSKCHTTLDLCRSPCCSSSGCHGRDISSFPISLGFLSLVSTQHRTNSHLQWVKLHTYQSVPNVTEKKINRELCILSRVKLTLGGVLDLILDLLTTLIHNS
jgi:hypothetical protein